MALQSPRRLPRRFSRPASKGTKILVQRRRERSKERQKEAWRRFLRRVQRFTEALRKSLLWILLSVFVGLAVLGVVMVLFSPLLGVRSIRIARNDPRLDVSVVRHALAPLFKRRLAFVTRSQVEELIVQSLPDIRTVNIEKNYPSELKVSITIDPLVARLQIVDPDGNAQTASGIALDALTDEGLYVVAAAVDQVAGLPEVRVVDWGVRPEPGRPVVEKELFRRMQAAEAALRDQWNVPLRSRTVYVRAREFHLQLPDYVLWFDLTTELADQLQRYSLFLQTVGPEKVKEYIDLRLVDKVVYK